MERRIADGRSARRSARSHCHDCGPTLVEGAACAEVTSGNRDYPITARAGNVGTYPQRPSWTMAAGDVVAGGIGDFIENVERWAGAIVEALAKPD